MQAKFTYLGAVALLFLSSCYVVVEEPYDPRNNFVGTYETEEWSTVYGGTTYYDVTISKSGYQDGRVWISNFYGIDLEVSGTVRGDEITIPNQYNGDFEVSGWGYLDNQGRLRLEFSIVEHRVFSDRYDECDAVLYRY